MSAALSLDNVGVDIGGRSLLRRIDFEAQSGELVAIVGANGAGKTTLLRAIAGLHPSTGGIEVDGSSLVGLAPRERARRIALVTGDDALLEGTTVRDAVAAGRYAHHPWWDWHESRADEAAIDNALSDVELDWAGARAMASLSSGERQRAWIALALAQETPLLLLDEPTSHLDIRYAIEVLELLRRVARRGQAVVVVLHALEEVIEYADRVAVLGEGTTLAFGRPREILGTEILERAYQVKLEVISSEGAFFLRRKSAP